MNNEKKFSGRSDNYSRHRPGYPSELVDQLRTEFGLNKESVIADIGSGTGKLAEIFLENENMVYCVEPNSDMRSKALEDLSRFTGFTIIDGSAEHTTLPDHSIDFIVAGQSFHWFDPLPSRKEFVRILRPGGIVVLIWNDRVQKQQGIMREYEEICRKFSNGYHQSGSKAVDEKIISNFFKENYGIFSVPNIQKLDMEGLKGRYFSASYSITPDDERYDELIQALKSAFQKNEKDGFVYLEYQTKIYSGSLSF